MTAQAVATQAPSSPQSVVRTPSTGQRAQAASQRRWPSSQSTPHSLCAQIGLPLAGASQTSPAAAAVVEVAGQIGAGAVAGHLGAGARVAADAVGADPRAADRVGADVAAAAAVDRIGVGVEADTRSG
ncbi:MAG: hypothetical protein R3F65_30985 [bacterium]